MPILDYLTGFNHRVLTLDGTVGGSTVAIDTTTVRRTGGTSIKLAASSTLPRWELTVNGSPNIYSFAVYWCPTVLDSSGTDRRIISCRDNAAGVHTFFWQRSGQINLPNSTFFAVSTGTWYRLEAQYDLANALLDWGVAVGDATFSVSGNNTSFDSTGLTLNSLFLGANSSDSTVNNIWTSYYTDLVTSQQSADYPIGPTQVLGYSPNAVGTHNLDAATSSFFFSDTSAPPGSAGTALTTSETTSYQMIDEVPLDSGTDAIKVKTSLSAPTLNTPTFRSAGAWSFTGNNVSASGSLTPGAPAGKTAGDLLLLAVESRGIGVTVTTPSGWNLMTNFPKASGTASGGKIFLYTRIADGSGTDTPSVSYSGATSGTSGDATGAGILAFTNLTETQDATAVSQDLSAQVTTSSITGITTATDNSMVINVAMKLNESSGQTASITTYTEASDNSTTSGTGHIVETSYKVQTAHGASGSGTITWSATTSARAFITTIALQASTSQSVIQPTDTWYVEYDFAPTNNDIDYTAGTSGGTINIGNAAIRTAVAQPLPTKLNLSFIGSLTARVGKTGAPTDNLVCAIQADSNGVPSGTDLATATVAGTSLTTSTVFTTFTFNATIPATNQIWLVFRRSGAFDASNYYIISEVTFGTGNDLAKAWVNDGVTPWILGSGGYSFPLTLSGIQPVPTQSINPYAIRAIVAQELDTAVASTWAAKLFDFLQGANTEDISNGSISTTTRTYVGKTFTTRPLGQPINQTAIGNLEAIDGGATFKYAGASPFSGAGGYLKSFTVSLATVNTPTDNLLITIQLDNGGSPSGTDLATLATISGSSLTGGVTDITTTFSTQWFLLNSSLTYWIVFTRSGAADATNYYKVFGDFVSTTPVWKTQTANGGAWATTTNLKHARLTLSVGPAWSLDALNATRLRFGYTAAASGDPRLAGAMLEAAFPIRSFIFDTRRISRNSLLRR